MLLRDFALAHRIAAAVLGLAGVVGTAMAQSRDSAAAPLPVSVSGFVDTYFDYNMAQPRTHVNALRNFDVTAGQFTVSMAQVTVQKAAAPVGFRVDLDLGQGNDIVQSGATGSLANVLQAYATIVAPVGAGLTIDAGKFVTHCCYETIPSKDNFNYSRSLLFSWSVPYYHLGIRASYPVSGTLTLNGYLYNGWNGIEVNSGKTFGFEAAFAPSGAWSFVLNWLGGPADPDSVSNSFRNIYEAIATFQATEKLTLAANAIYGQDEPFGRVALWRGVAAYAKYVLTDVSAFAVRGEAFADPEGFMTLIPQNLYETTLTYEFKPFASLILRSEYRYDWSSKPAFDGAGGAQTRRNQATLGMGAVVVF